MKFRIAMWAAIGLGIAGGWALYSIVAFPSGLMGHPVVLHVALLSQPIALASFAFHFRIGVYWVLLANAVTYGFIGLIAEMLRHSVRASGQGPAGL